MKQLSLKIYEFIESDRTSHFIPSGEAAIENATSLAVDGFTKQFLHTDQRVNIEFYLVLEFTPSDFKILILHISQEAFRFYVNMRQQQRLQ